MLYLRDVFTKFQLDIMVLFTNCYVVLTKFQFVMFLLPSCVVFTRCLHEILTCHYTIDAFFFG